MRQVPAKYLIIGRGRLASHLANYFQLLKIPFHVWTRDQSEGELNQLIGSAERVLLAIKDDAIEPFIERHGLPAAKTIHFSGTLSTKSATRLHPLMTFSKEMYPLDEYQRIPFVGEEGQPELKTLIPELDNPSFMIPKNSHNLYHALCVLSGNGTVVLWQAIFKMFEEKLNLPKEILLPYLERVSQNIHLDSKNALTGPWVRGDFKTVERNQNALAGTPLHFLYNAMFNTFLSNQPARSTPTSDKRSSP